MRPIRIRLLMALTTALLVLHLFASAALAFPGDPGFDSFPGDPGFSVTSTGRGNR
ncbi:MAG TPA: hypothetical protein VMJ92_03780 [Candidatus Limnocylindrales bacterium]|nr:hypothetical protein [Candidatus Limnocylindrales bacterium]